MRYKEFEEKIEDWGEKYNYSLVIKTNLDYMILENDNNVVCLIHKSKRFVIEYGLNWTSYRKFSDDAKRELFKIVTEFAATKPEDREDIRTFRFEISAYAEIDIEAKDLNEARKRADEIWYETFKNGLFGDVEFIKEVKGD